MNRSVALSIRILFTLSFILALTFSSCFTAKADSGNTLTISGDSNLIQFQTNWDVASLPMFWGVSGLPMQPDTITFVNRQAQLIPPKNTVSMFFNQPGVTVSTTFTALTSDGWYAVPQATDEIVVSGSIALVQFISNFDPAPLSVTWGVSGLPAVTQTVTFTNRVASLIPPKNTVSMLFAPSGIKVTTSFPNLGFGWYQVPAVTPTPTPSPTPNPIQNNFIYLPLVTR